MGKPGTSAAGKARCLQPAANVNHHAARHLYATDPSAMRLALAECGCCRAGSQVPPLECTIICSRIDKRVLRTVTGSLDGCPCFLLSGSRCSHSANQPASGPAMLSTLLRHEPASSGPPSLPPQSPASLASSTAQVLKVLRCGQGAAQARSIATCREATAPPDVLANRAALCGSSPDPLHQSRDSTMALPVLTAVAQSSRKFECNWLHCGAARIIRLSSSA